MGLRRVAVLALLALLAWPAAGFAQARGSSTIGGNVLDPEAKAVVEAAVLVRNEATGEMRTTTTDGRGHFASPTWRRVRTRLKLRFRVSRSCDARAFR